jgi:hypothetical protein
MPLNIDIKCKICNKQFSHFNSFSIHLKSHNLNSKLYYDQFIKTDEEHLCNRCKEKETRFNGYFKGYTDYCIRCSVQNSWECDDGTRKENFS